MSLASDPMPLFSADRECALPEWGEVKTNDVRFNHIQDLFQCIETLLVSMPLAVVATDYGGRTTEAVAHGVSFRRTDVTPPFCTEISYEVAIYTDIDVFRSLWLDRELRQCTRHGKRSHVNLFSLDDCTTPIRMRNRFHGETPCYIVFSELAAAARKKRSDKLAALLMGTRVQNAPCAVKRFAQHELSERQLFLVIKTFL